MNETEVLKVNNLINEMNKYRGEYKLVVQKDGDGGDTLNRVAHFCGALKILDSNSSEPVLQLYLNRICNGLPAGRYRRHPDTNKWYSNPDNVTRDQMSPTIAALILNGLTVKLKQHLRLRVRRGLLHFSTQDQVEGKPGAVKHKLPDLPGLPELANIIRGLNIRVLYPLLYVLDLATLASVGSDLREGQVILNLAVAESNMSTFVSKWAIKKLKAKETAAMELRYYYRESDGGNGIEPLGELMIMAMNKLTGVSK